MKQVIEYLKFIYDLYDYDLVKIDNYNGENKILYICKKNNINRYLLRISFSKNRIEEDFYAETEFVHYLFINGAKVLDVIPSVRNKFVESVKWKNDIVYVSLFDMLNQILMIDNNIKKINAYDIALKLGNTIGRIHEVSKTINPTYQCVSYFDIYNKEYIEKLIPDAYKTLKIAVIKRLEEIEKLPVSNSVFGLIHFNLCESNYSINYNNEINIFNFDHCMYGWYMFDLATLWIQGINLYVFEKDYFKRMMVFTKLLRRNDRQVQFTSAFAFNPNEQQFSLTS